MSISGIQAGSAQYDIFQQERRVREQADKFGLGPSTDTVSISPEARQLAQAAGNSPAEEEAGDNFLDKAAKPADPVESSPKSLKKMSLLGLMMESLFLAELDESSAPAANGETRDGQEENLAGKESSVLQDSEKSAALKKLLNDFIKGKVDLSDIPAALALGQSGASGAEKLAARNDLGGNSVSPEID